MGGNVGHFMNLVFEQRRSVWQASPTRSRNAGEYFPVPKLKMFLETGSSGNMHKGLGLLTIGLSSVWMIWLN